MSVSPNVLQSERAARRQGAPSVPPIPAGVWSSLRRLHCDSFLSFGCGAMALGDESQTAEQQEYRQISLFMSSFLSINRSIMRGNSPPSGGGGVDGLMVHWRANGRKIVAAHRCLVHFPVEYQRYILGTERFAPPRCSAYILCIARGPALRAEPVPVQCESHCAHRISRSKATDVRDRACSRKCCR